MFEDSSVRRVWVEKEEKWYFAIVDVVQALTDSSNPHGYITDMKRRDSILAEGWWQIATPLAIITNKGSQKINCANVQGVLRIIQSVPSKKAEPFKIWMAKVGYERLQETADPSLALERARKNWQMRGMSEKWIDTRMRGQDTRNKLTNYWATHEVKEGAEFAQLTDVIHVDSHRGLMLANTNETLRSRLFVEARFETSLCQNVRESTDMSSAGGTLEAMAGVPSRIGASVRIFRAPFSGASMRKETRMLALAPSVASSVRMATAVLPPLPMT